MMDLVDLIVIVVECLFVGFGMELGAVVAKVLSVRLLNDASPVTVHDSEDEADDEEEEEEEKKRRRRKRAAKSVGGPSTASGFRAM